MGSKGGGKKKDGGSQQQQQQLKKQKPLMTKQQTKPRPDAAAPNHQGSAKPQEGQSTPSQAGDTAGAAASVAPSQTGNRGGYFQALVGGSRDDSDNNSSAGDGAEAVTTRHRDTDPNSDDNDDDSEEGAVGDDDVDDDLAHDILRNRASAASQQSGSLLASGGSLEAVLVGAVTKAVEAEKTPPAWVLNMLMPGAVHQHDIQQVNPRSLASDLDAENRSGMRTTVSVQQTPAQNMNVSTPTNSSINPVHQNTVNQASPNQVNQQTVNQDTTTPVTQTTVNQEVISTARFTLKANDLPPDLKLEGLPHEDVPEKMALYRAHIGLLSADNVSQSTIDHRAIKHLALFVRGAAAQSLSLMLSSSLEWRPPAQLNALRARGEVIRITPPKTWKEWVTAFTTSFAPANRIALLARDVMTLEAKSSESVDVFALRVSRAYAKLLAEAERTAPLNVPPHEHAFNQALTASFENGVHPHIRVEMMRADPSDSFMESKARARRHESNKLRSPPAPISATASTVYGSARSGQLQTTAQDNRDRISALENYISGQEAFVSSGGAYSTQRGGRPQRGTDKRDRDNSKSRGPPARAKAKVSFAGTTKSDTDNTRKECDFIGCRFSSIRFTHTRAECKNEEAAKKEGYKVTKD